MKKEMTKWFCRILIAALLWDPTLAHALCSPEPISSIPNVSRLSLFTLEALAEQTLANRSIENSPSFFRAPLLIQLRQTVRTLRTTLDRQPFRLAGTSRLRRGNTNIFTLALRGIVRGIDDRIQGSAGDSAVLGRLTNPEIVRYVTEAVQHTDAAAVRVVDDLIASQLFQEALDSGEIVPTRDGNFYARSHPKDTKRSVARTFVSTNDVGDKSEMNKHQLESEFRPTVEAKIKGTHSGKTVYVIPYLAGPTEASPFTRVGVQVTDNRMVVIQTMLLYHVGDVAIQKLNDVKQFSKGVHVTGNLDAIQRTEDENDDRYFTGFTDKREFILHGSGYGGNAIAPKKFDSLRLASADARREGWLAEHMLIAAIEDLKTGRTDYIAAAFPSQSGKTNLAMLQPPKALRSRYKVSVIGDDIAHMRIGEDGRLYAVNPESGFFGVAPGTNRHTNPNAMKAIGPNTKTLFTNTAFNPKTGDVWWEGKTKKRPSLQGDGQYWEDWTGKRITDRKTRKEKAADWAEANSRFTTRLSNAPNYMPNPPQGVPITAIFFGGRVATREPLIRQLPDALSGVYDGLVMGVETTAAEEGKTGRMKRDSMAMAPFMSTSERNYALHWIDMMEKLGDKAPAFFHVNWFLKDKNGKFLWPGYGENLRPILWALDRAHGEGVAVDSPIGERPTKAALNMEGLPMSDEKLDQLLVDIDMEAWREEAAARGEFLKKINAPEKVLQAHERFVTRLNRKASRRRRNRQSGFFDFGIFGFKGGHATPVAVWAVLSTIAMGIVARVLSHLNAIMAPGNALRDKLKNRGSLLAITSA